MTVLSLFFFLAGDPCASQSHRSGMAENVRTVLSQLHEKHPEQHGDETAAMAEHDLHLERSIVFVTVVGQVTING